MSVENPNVSKWEHSVLATGMGAEELAAVEGIVVRERYKAGTTVFQLGDDAHEIMVIEAGSVALTLPLLLRQNTRELTIEQKHPGAVIGWSALVSPYKYVMSVRTVSDVVLARMNREALEGLFKQNQRLHLNILRNLNGVIANRVILFEALLIRELQRWAVDQLS